MNCTCIHKPGEVIQVDVISNPICPKCGLRLFGEEIKMCFFKKVWRDYIRYIGLGLGFLLGASLLIGFLVGIIGGMVYMVIQGNYWVLWIPGIILGLWILRAIGKWIMGVR